MAGLVPSIRMSAEPEPIRRGVCWQGAAFFVAMAVSAFVVIGGFGLLIWGGV